MVNLEMHAPMRAQSVPLAGGDAGIQQTIRAMRNLIEQGKKDPVIHELAADILHRAQVPAHDHLGEARAIGEAVYRNVRFTRDVYGKETLHAAREVARLRIGDCDDFVILICSLLGTIGHKTRIVTVSNHPEDPSQFSHVYPETYVNSRWVPVDFARRSPEFGKAPESYFRKREWSTTSDEYIDIEGLNGQTMGYDPRRLPMAYRVNVEPRFRARPPYGMGNYGARALSGLRGLGDATDILTALTPLVQAGTTGAANIIRAENTPSYAPPNFGIPSTLPGTIGGISTGTMMIGGLAVLALVVFGGKH